MKHFAVIGHPIGHSLSPLMHNTAFKLLGLDCQYELRDIEPASLKRSIEQFKEQNWGGFNITVPHKESIIPLIDEVVPEALKIGAVNTVVIRNGKSIGYNTDIIGVEKALLPVRSKIEGQPCMIIGSGGAARSVAHVLIHDFGIPSIVFVALYPEQAHALVKSLGENNAKFQVVPSNDKEIEKAIKSCALIVNATAIGMYPQILDTPISNNKWISGRHIVFDVIYRPLTTRLVNEAKTAGAVTLGGLEMFIHQGAAAFRLWTDRDMPLEEVRRVLEEKLASK
jgi:shikimate dehydrogenase